MNGIILISLSFITTAFSQVLTGTIYPSSYDRRYVDGSHIGDSYVGHGSSSGSTGICRFPIEYAEHDRNGYVETCRFRCRGYAICRRRPRSIYGICCTRRHFGGDHIDQDIHCPDGQPSAGPCDIHPPIYRRCYNSNHYQCVRTTYRPGYSYPARGICCRHPQQRY